MSFRISGRHGNVLVVLLLRWRMPQYLLLGAFGASVKLETYDKKLFLNSEKAGLENIPCYDTDRIITTAVNAVRILIEKDNR